VGTKKDKIILGVTGNIGGGKSTVCGIFEKLGAVRISSDELAKVYTGENSPIQAELLNEFGPEILDERGIFDRKKIASIVFGDKSKLEKLNRMIHPLVRRDFWQKAESVKNGVIAWEVPLLFETDAHKSCDYTLTVFSSDKIAIDRVRQREEKLTEEDYKARSTSQIPVKEKVKLSDFSIENDGTLEELTGKVKAIYAKITTN